MMEKIKREPMMDKRGKTNGELNLEKPHWVKGQVIGQSRSPISQIISVQKGASSSIFKRQAHAQAGKQCVLKVPTH